jgi:uncharacterized sulfatase
LSSDDQYPFKRVFTAADVASMMKPEAVPQLRGFLKDSDSGVRYWGAMGALMRGPAAVETLHAELIAALDDTSPSVRIAAAEALAKHGSAADVSPALAALRECADPTRTSAYAGIEAMNTIDELGAKAAPLFPFIKTMPTSDPNAVARGNGYVERLKAYVISKNDPSAPTPGTEERKKKRAKKKAE